MFEFYLTVGITLAWAVVAGVEVSNNESGDGNGRALSVLITSCLVVSYGLIWATRLCR